MGKRGTQMTRTLQQDFEHFLSYSGLASESEDVRAKLLVAYTANWSVLGKGSAVQRLMHERDMAIHECGAKQAEIDRLMLQQAEIHWLMLPNISEGYRSGLIVSAPSKITLYYDTVEQAEKAFAAITDLIDAQKEPT
jgi:hypothetical protein